MQNANGESQLRQDPTLRTCLAAGPVLQTPASTPPAANNTTTPDARCGRQVSGKTPCEAGSALRNELRYWSRHLIQARRFPCQRHTILKGQFRPTQPSPGETMPPSFLFSVDGKRESGHVDRNPAAAHAEPELQGASSGLVVWCDVRLENGGASSIRPWSKEEGKPRHTCLQVKQLLKEATRN